jgi:hypothetical protein
MNLREVLDLVASTPLDGWHEIPLDNVPLSPLSTPFGQRCDGEPDAHQALLVHIEHPPVAVAYAMSVGDNLKCNFGFPDPRVNRHIVDILLNGATVHRESLLCVDGGRCWLPYHCPVSAKTGPTHIQEVARTVTSFEVAVARLVDSTRGHASEFDSYLQRAGLTVVPGHPLDPPETPPAD